MKRQLNIICVLVFLCLGISLLPHLYAAGVGFTSGFKAGFEEGMKEESLTSNEGMRPVHFSLMPDYKSWIDNGVQVLNLKDGTALPIQLYETIVWMKESQRILPGFLYFLLELVYLVTTVWALLSFYKLINKINHQVIFDWVNVRRLNKLGILLLISAFSIFVLNTLNYLTIRELIEVKGHTHNFFQVFDTIYLVLGLISLLVGRIFAMGITLREEQELTI